MILDHIGFGVRDGAASLDFFTAALAPLGITPIAQHAGWYGMGRQGKPELWFGTHATPQSPMHLAFVADDREQVRQFYAAALKAGAQDNGPPGIRAIYHPNYYGAFVIGPDGHNVEAVCHHGE